MARERVTHGVLPGTAEGRTICGLRLKGTASWAPAGMTCKSCLELFKLEVELGPADAAWCRGRAARAVHGNRGSGRRDWHGKHGLKASVATALAEALKRGRTG